MCPRPEQTHIQEENLLLASLPRRRYGELLSSLRPTSFEFGQVLQEPGDLMKYAVFPVTAMLSVVAERGDGGRSVEIAVVGRDGMSPLSAILGRKKALYRIIAQLPGTALRLPLAVVREAAARPGPFQDAVHTYTMALIVELSRSAVCNAFHGIERRLARWILRTHDYARADQFPMRQDFMAKMLAARRVSVTQAAHGLRRTGVIDYRRGRLTMLDRAALERLTCDCYHLVREAYGHIPED